MHRASVPTFASETGTAENDTGCFREHRDDQHGNKGAHRTRQADGESDRGGIEEGVRQRGGGIDSVQPVFAGETSRTGCFCSG